MTPRRLWQVSYVACSHSPPDTCEMPLSRLCQVSYDDILITVYVLRLAAGVTRLRQVCVCGFAFVPGCLCRVPGCLCRVRRAPWAPCFVRSGCLCLVRLVRSCSCVCVGAFAFLGFLFSVFAGFAGRGSAVGSSPSCVPSLPLPLRVAVCLWSGFSCLVLPRSGLLCRFCSWLVFGGRSVPVASLPSPFREEVYHLKKRLPKSEKYRAERSFHFLFNFS